MQPLCQYQYNMGPTSPWYTSPNCVGFEELIQIYYRDAWAAKVTATKCTPLSADALAKGPAPSQYIAWPNFTFSMFALVPPLVPGSWSGAFINACQ